MIIILRHLGLDPDGGVVRMGMGMERVRKMMGLAWIGIDANHQVRFPTSHHHQLLTAILLGVVHVPTTGLEAGGV